VLVAHDRSLPLISPELHRVECRMHSVDRDFLKASHRFRVGLLSRYGTRTGQGSIDRREGSARRVKSRFLVALALGGIAACDTVSIPETLLTPDRAGVVAMVEPLPGRQWRYRFEDGTQFTLDGAVYRLVYSDTVPTEGDLMLLGEGPDGPWVARVPAGRGLTNVPDCFILETQGIDHGEYINTEAGLRLRKAPNFDAGYSANPPRYANPTSYFCLTADGLVSSYE